MEFGGCLNGSALLLNRGATSLGTDPSSKTTLKAIYRTTIFEDAPSESAILRRTRARPKCLRTEEHAGMAGDSTSNK